MSNKTNALFEPLEISIISEDLFAIFGLIQTIVFVVTIFTFCMLVYVVLFHTPRRIGNYKWYILLNAIFGFGFQLFSVIFRPFPLLPYPILIIHGVVDIYIRIIDVMPPQLLADITLNLALLFLMAFFYSTTCMFIYRYLQTTQNERLRSFSNIKNYLLSYVIMGAIGILFAVIPINMQLLSNEELKNGLMVSDPVIYNFTKNHFVVGFSTETGVYYLFAGVTLCILGAICCILVILSIFACYRYLRENEGTFSPKTAQLYRLLLNMLVIDLIVAGSTGVITLSLCLLSFLTHFEFGSHIALISLGLGDFYPLFTHLLTLFYIEPYRTAFLNALNLRVYFLKATENLQLEQTSVTKATLFTQRPARRSIFFTKL